MTRLLEYDQAPPEVRAVYDAIKAARGWPDVNNCWKALAVHPPTLSRTWESLSQVMAAGALDPLVKEMRYWPSPSPMAATTASPATPPRHGPRA